MFFFIFSLAELHLRIHVVLYYTTDIDHFYYMNIMKKTTIQQLYQEIATTIFQHVDPRTHRVFIFGSRARGDNSERSDIDIGIEGPTKIPGYTMTNIREALDLLPTLLSFDVIDFYSASDKFKKEAYTTIKPLSHY